MVRLTLPILTAAFVLLTSLTTAQNNWEFITATPATYVAPVLTASANGFDFEVTNNYPDAGRLLRSDDGGANWEEIASPNGGYPFHAINVDANGTLYATSYKDVFSSTDNGDTWTNLNFDVSFRENCTCGIDPFWCEASGLTAVFFDNGELRVQSHASWRWANCYRNYKQSDNSLAQWYNLQWPEGAELDVNESLTVYGQIWIEGLTAQNGATPDVRMWAGRGPSGLPPTSGAYSWFEGTFNGDRDNNDEFKVDVTFADSGDYDIVTRYQIGDGQYVYGGLGGPWDGQNNVAMDVRVNLVQVEIDWCNLQWPHEVTVDQGDPIDYYAQVYVAGETEAAGENGHLKAWVGYRTASQLPWNYDWTWVPATYHEDKGNNDEYKAVLDGAHLLSAGDYQIMSRFLYGNGPYLYGGTDGVYGAYGIAHVEGAPPINIGWCNLQWPGNVTVGTNDSAAFYAQIWIDGVTATVGEDTRIEAWIGYNDANVGPEQNGWSWRPATWFKDAGNNDEYRAFIGLLPSQRYYVVSRFRINGGPFVYGGFSQQGGNFWGNNASSSILDVLSSPVQRLAHPEAPATSIEELGTLSQNYPNPFTESTTLEVNVPKGKSGNVVVFDLLGHQVLDEPVKEGYTQVRLDGESFPSGGMHIALLRIEGQRVATTTMQVVK